MAWLAGLWFLVACSGKESAPDATSTPPNGRGNGSAPLLPPDTVEPGGTGPQYPGTGFRVHEWGTNTIVVGSDGSMQRGLHHEEEDLPGFVYDRRNQEVAVDSQPVKMETPVTYFYSDVPVAANVSVSFPKGVLSQWYPRVKSFYPPIFKGRGDPALDPAFPFVGDSCREAYGQINDGNLDWSQIEVMPRDATPNAPEAPLDKYTWSHARAVAANGLRVGDQEERFLFYRGLGNFEIPVAITSQDGGVVAVTNKDMIANVGAVFVLRVTPNGASFRSYLGGLAPSATLTDAAPGPLQPLDAYAQDLATSMVLALDRAGLYHDESIAMVKTWARQWFRTPGTRVLYLAPQSWTEAQIPLAVQPTPAEMVRVMVIRVEALSRADEAADLAAMPGLDANEMAAEKHFVDLGRFAEPRLRRALALSGIKSPHAETFLQSISGASVDVRAGE